MPKTKMINETPKQLPHPKYLGEKKYQNIEKNKNQTHKTARKPKP